MKVTYRFVTGEYVIVDVPVTKAVEKVIEETNRTAEANARWHRRHTYSIDGMVYEGSQYGMNDEYFMEEMLEEESARIKSLFGTLTPKQRRYVVQLYQGKSITDIADTEGVAVQTIHESIKSVRKKVLKIYKNHPDKLPKKVRNVKGGR